MATRCSGLVAILGISLEKVGIAKYFRIQVYADKVGVSKPDRRIFIYPCRVLNIDSENAVLVGRGSSDMYVLPCEGYPTMPDAARILCGAAGCVTRS